MKTTKTISLAFAYRNFYVSDTRRKPNAPEGHTRLWLNDGIHNPSYSGNYDIPSRMVGDCLAYFEQDGTQTVEFKDLN
jgi:hypothetical protein